MLGITTLAGSFDSLSTSSLATAAPDIPAAMLNASRETDTVLVMVIDPSPGCFWRLRRLGAAPLRVYTPRAEGAAEKKKGEGLRLPPSTTGLARRSAGQLEHVERGAGAPIAIG